ncbi:MAG: beta-phosphoglucomutase family hydrolase [Spirochaetaceae bacterium]
MNGFELKGAIFDLDGVITATARSHFRAWKATFEGFLKETNREDNPTFTYEDDYIPYVDGKPRYDGVKAFLESRGVELPWGDPSDEPGNATICGVGNRKNGAFRRTVEEDGVDLYDSTLRLVRELKARGVKVGVASSSKNTGFVLETVGLSKLFETVVDGVVSAQIGLKGKPAPDIFIEAADRLGLTPRQCMMVEDAYAGVEAGRNGNFAFVLGVNREGDAEGLYQRGADLVVKDLEEVSLRVIDDWFDRGIDEDSWQLSYYGFDPDSERLREALTTSGNGYVGVRGAYVGRPALGETHYPGTYLAGLYNRAATEVGDTEVFNNDFVNCPNWLRVDLSLAGGKPLTPEQTTVIRWEHRLNMAEATTSLLAEFRDEDGRETRIETARFVSMDSPHLAVLRYTFTPLNYSADVSLTSTLDGEVTNHGVERYRPLESRHLEEAETRATGGNIRLESRTRNSQITVSMEAHHELYRDGSRQEVEGQVREHGSRISESFSFPAQEGRVYELQKVVWIATDRPWPIERATMPRLEALKYEELAASHRKRWEALWKVADMVVDGDRFVQRASRLHVYHLLATASIHNQEMDVGLPARGLHGEAYRGHVFWDELFIAPFFNRVVPEVTRSHLLYRYRRLEEAREIALDAGFSGALYPWQSADTGERESQRLHYNPRSGEWDPDLSRLQRHVSIAIAHNIWEYHYTTGDQEFMNQHGVEMLLEIARFWASTATWEEGDRRFHITGVMGPDEFHEKYPDRSYEEGGFRDNAYTNVLVAWLLDRVAGEFRALEDPVRQRLKDKIAFREEELEEWERIVEGLAVPIDEEGILSQFEGFRKLRELDWEGYREKYEDLRRMDRILKAEGDSPDNYQLTKQADTLMIWYILTPREVAELLRRMGYSIPDPLELLRRNYDYYLPRTSHGSTLSYVVHAAVLANLKGHQEESRRWFLEAIRSDIHDTQGGTTLEGIHCGVMAGSLQIIIDNFTGLTITEDELTLSPALPEAWTRVGYSCRWRSSLLSLSITREEVSVALEGEGSTPRTLRLAEEAEPLTPGGEVRLPYSGG